ncbi:MAG: type II secretion system F family protein [Vicinamibacterales bacterium]
MTPVVLTFVLVAALVVVPYWLFVLRPEQRAQRALLGRLKTTRKPVADRLGLMKAAYQLSSIGSLHEALAQRRSLLKPVERLIEQSGSKLNVATLLLLSGVAALLTLVLVTWATGYLALGGIAAAIVAWVPVGVLTWKRTRRLLAFEENFPEALELLSRSLQAGHAFSAGLSMVADELGAPIGPEFRTLYDQQRFGMPLPEALKAFAERVPVIDAKFFATAIILQRESGGNLSEILINLASVIRDRFKVKRQIRVIAAHGKMTGMVLTGVPPALGLALFVVSPQHWRMLLTDPLGIKLVVAAALLQVTGGLIIRQLVRIEY